jgi:hypothetical protein
MIDAYKILAKIDLPKDVRREAGKLNIYVGKVFTNKAAAQKLIQRTLNNPEHYEVVQVYRSSINPFA